MSERLEELSKAVVTQGESVGTTLSPHELMELVVLQREEIQRLQAIVTQLRHTEDGVPMFDHMIVYCNGTVTYPNRSRMRLKSHFGKVVTILSHPGHFKGQMFSTKAAAVEALEQE